MFFKIIYGNFKRIPVAGVLIAIIFSIILLSNCAQKNTEDSQVFDIDGNTAGTPTPLEVVDEVLRELSWVSIIFNPPKTMRYKNPVKVELLLSARKTVGELQKELDRQEDIHSARVKASNLMRARLTGSNGMQILALSSEEQAISGESTTRWEWEVLPVEAGNKMLHLTLSAIITVVGDKMPRDIVTFDRSITVEISFGQSVGGFVSENWQWLWAAVFLPVATYVWNRFRKGKIKKHD